MREHQCRLEGPVDQYDISLKAIRRVAANGDPPDILFHIVITWSCNLQQPPSGISAQQPPAKARSREKPKHDTKLKHLVEYH